MPRDLPETKVSFEQVTLTDENPIGGERSTFTFTTKMIAWPLTKLGEPGTEPDGKAPWWSLFQVRHTQSSLYWVQGHLLNHKIHGKGEPINLVPISNTLNTNMETIIESFAKKLVQDGEVLYYEVNVHFDGAKAAKEAQMREYIKIIKGVWPSSEDGLLKLRIQMHPSENRRAMPNLLWGEQFVPTRLSWSLKKSTNWKVANDWNVQSHQFVDVTRMDEHYSPDQWNNNFPQ